ncbi:DUF3825 domain-containing protein [Embleya sp. NPDC059237]|uniref:DUF3825 domain-containing protein n=1 Tax=Embleya sp. NPDC059237 TaxID=3346784 RepID=UPI0036ADE19B
MSAPLPPHGTPRLSWSDLAYIPCEEGDQNAFASLANLAEPEPWDDPQAFENQVPLPRLVSYFGATYRRLCQQDALVESDDSSLVVLNTGLAHRRTGLDILGVFAANEVHRRRPHVFKYWQTLDTNLRERITETPRRAEYGLTEEARTLPNLAIRLSWGHIQNRLNRFPPAYNSTLTSARTALEAALRATQNRVTAKPQDAAPVWSESRGTMQWLLPLSLSRQHIDLVLVVERNIDRIHGDHLLGSTVLQPRNLYYRVRALGPISARWVLKC